MNKFILSLFLLLCSNKPYAQVCNIIVNATAHRITSDTTLTYDSSPVMQSWVPCPGKFIQLDSAITQIDTFYLREGNTLNIDSLSTMAGGFVVYADSGSVVDCNFKQTLLIYYTPNTILKDTIGWGNKVLCSDIVFDFSNMIEAHDCNTPLSTTDRKMLFYQLANGSSQWTINFPQSIHGKAILYNLYAQVVQQYECKGSQLNIQHNHLVPGLYFLKLQTDCGDVILKLTAQ